MDNIPTWVALTISSIVAIAVAILVQVFVVPWQRKKILGGSKNGKPVKFTFGDSDGNFEETFSPIQRYNNFFFSPQTHQQTAVLREPNDRFLTFMTQTLYQRSMSLPNFNLLTTNQFQRLTSKNLQMAQLLSTIIVLRNGTDPSLNRQWKETLTSLIQMR